METEKNPMQLNNRLHFSQISSTNTYLKDLTTHQRVEEFTVVTADFQVIGRGQRGNKWEAEAGKNLLMSLIVYPEFLPNNRQFLLSKLTAVCLCEVFMNYAEHFSIKWPNDLYWKDLKIAGTLIENEWTGQHIDHAIIGNGINLNQERFTSDAPNPISLYQILGKEVDRERFLGKFYAAFCERYASLKSGEIHELNSTYHSLLYRREGFHDYQDPNGVFAARIIEITDDGRLHLEDANGQLRSYWFKEVQFILPRTL